MTGSKNNHIIIKHLLIAGILLAMILLPSFSLAAKRVEVTLQPVDTTVQEESSAVFRARAKNDTGITWRMVSPDGRTEFLVKEVGDYFPGVTVYKKNSDVLTLRHVTAAMHGWQVYCTFGGENRVETERATLYIEGMEQKTEEQEEEEKTSFAYTGNDRLIVQAVGAALETDGRTDIHSVDFSDRGKISFRVRGETIVDYWVINGARYDFDVVPRSIIVKDLTWPLTIEAVGRGRESQTLLSDEQLQAKRTGNPLLATSKSADMCHIRPKGYGAGGWFREFDFTDDFVNRATQKKEKGGRVTLNVRAYIPEGRKLSYWKFNDAKFIFAEPPREFTVHHLNESMLYRPVFENLSTPEPTERPTPEPTKVPEYRVECRSCDFSGGGYSHAKQGTVPAGTQITVYPHASDLGWWEGNLPFATGGTEDKPMRYTSLTFVVNQNINVTWMYPIN